MDSSGSVTLLIQHLRSEDPTVRDRAARLIWQRYFRDLLGLARKNLDKRIRLRASEEDVLQSMFKSFCLRQHRGEFALADRDNLWRVLVTITVRKARNAAGANRRARRDVRREHAAPEIGDELGAVLWTLEQISDAGPTPAEAALLNEALERRLGSLGNSGLRQIALWRLEGYTNQEIAERLDCTERAVERKFSRIRDRWISYDDEASRG